MNSTYSNIYLKLQQRIAEQVPEIRWVEQDFGQDTSDQWRPSVALPALLVDFPVTNYSGMGNMPQISDAVISLRLLVEVNAKSYSAAPDKVKREALKFYELEEKVVRAINGWVPEGMFCKPFTRTRVESTNRYDGGLRIRKLLFQTQFRG